MSQIIGNGKPVEEENSSVSLSDFFSLCRKYWMYCAASVFVCCVIAVLLAKSSPLSYQAEAQILIKGEKETGDLPTAALFSDLGIAQSSSGVNNEMIIINSVTMLKQAIIRINANVLYYHKGLLREVNIYKASPIKLTPASDMGENSFWVDIDVVDANEYEYRFHYVDKVSKDEVETEWKRAKFAEVVKEKYDFIVTKTEKFNLENDMRDLKVVYRDPFSMSKSLYPSLAVNTISKETSVLKMTINTDNFEMTKDILNSLISTYNDDVINDKNRVARNTENFIRDRIASLAVDLDGIDGKIEQLKRTNKIPDINTAAQQYVQTGEKYLDNLTQVETQISLVNYIYEFISKEENKYGLIPENIGIADLGIQNQITAYNKAILDLSKLMPGAGDENPYLREQKAVCDNLRGNVIASIQTLQRSLGIKRSQALAQANMMDSRISRVPGQEKEISDVLRQQQIKNSLYLYLLNKREENALQMAITEPNAKVIEEAFGEAIPVAPRTLNFLMIGFLLGLLIPAGSIYGYLWIQSLNTTIRVRRDIEDRSDIPVLGEVPTRKEGKTARDAADIIAVTDNGKDILTEAFRILRSNLRFFVDENDGENVGAKVIQFTSTTPGEGKSFFAVNLALSLAFSGKRTLLIDLDLRKGTLSKNLGLRRYSGVSTYLTDIKLRENDVIAKTDYSENLDIIPTGALPPNATNLLASKRFEEFINTLRTQYDYILLDTVPLSVIADPIIVNRVADLLVYVIRSNHIDRRYLPEVSKIKERNKIKNLAFVLNDVSYEDKGYAKYSHGYGYGYGIGYDFGDEKDKD